MREGYSLALELRLRQSGRASDGFILNSPVQLAIQSSLCEYLRGSQRKFFAHRKYPIGMPRPGILKNRSNIPTLFCIYNVMIYLQNSWKVQLISAFIPTTSPGANICTFPTPSLSSSTIRYSSSAYNGLVARYLILSGTRASKPASVF